MGLAMIKGIVIARKSLLEKDVTNVNQALVNSRNVQVCNSGKRFSLSHQLSLYLNPWSCFLF